ncbi:MAG: hypothetical protein N2Z20_00225 [Elusimicrobiales bacterium]|nr:hypothetical protein [Elusimicrobiales bacterium]
MIFLFLFSIFIFSQQQNNIKIFIDCKKYCDYDFIKESISFVDMVREYYYADVYISIDYEHATTNIKKYVISFEPLTKSNLNKKEITFMTEPNDSQDIIREKLVKRIKIGLLNYLSDHPIIDSISIDYRSNFLEKQLQNDPWKGWVFKLSFYTNLSGDRNYSSSALNSNIVASKTTRKEDLSFSYYNYFSNNKYKGYYETETKSSSFSGSYIYAFSNHIGGRCFLSMSRSTYQNYDFKTSICGSGEYSIFPYEQSLKTKLRFRTSICGYYYDYTEETIYNKTKELLTAHSVSFIWEIKRKWGNFENYMSYMYYLKDISKREFSIDSILSINIGKGFSFNLNGVYAIENTNLNISKKNLSLQEILLKTKEMKNNYSYSLHIGISYSFGSIYSSEINYVFN